MKVEGYDSAKIQEKIESIKKKLEERTKEMLALEDKISELEAEKDKISTERRVEAEESLENLTKEFVFTKTVSKKIRELQDAYASAKATREEIVSLYKKAFNKLSTRRVLLKASDLGMEYDSSKELLVLNSKGFGWAKTRYNGEVGKSSLITNIHDVRSVFSNPSVADYIQKHDKYEMFNAFVEAFSNFMIPEDFAKYEETKITNLNIPYYKCTITYDNSRPAFETDIVTDVKFETFIISDNYALYATFTTVRTELRFAMNSAEFKFGELFVFSAIWEQMEEEINKMISKISSITDNNRIVLEKLRRKIAHHVVADEL